MGGSEAPKMHSCQARIRSSSGVWEGEALGREPSPWFRRMVGDEEYEVRSGAEFPGLCPPSHDGRTDTAFELVGAFSPPSLAPTEAPEPNAHRPEGSFCETRPAAPSESGAQWPRRLTTGVQFAKRINPRRRRSAGPVPRPDKTDVGLLRISDGTDERNVAVGVRHVCDTWHRSPSKHSWRGRTTREKNSASTGGRA